jgi:hypothetical protein
MTEVEKFFREYNNVSPTAAITDQHNLFKMMQAYRDKSLDENDRAFCKVMIVVNRLVNACLKKDQDKVDKWLSQYGKEVSEGIFGMDWRKLLEEQ